VVGWSGEKDEGGVTGRERESGGKDGESGESEEREKVEDGDEEC
jgi:hypothetical protein